MQTSKTDTKQKVMGNIADRLKELRNEKKLSQAELSRELNVTQQSVAMWESASRVIRADSLLGICEFFNVSSDYLLGLSAFKNPSYEYSENKLGLNADTAEALMSYTRSVYEVKNNDKNETEDASSRHLMYMVNQMLTNASFASSEELKLKADLTAFLRRHVVVRNDKKIELLNDLIASLVNSALISEISKCLQSLESLKESSLRLDFVLDKMLCLDSISDYTTHRMKSHEIARSIIDKCVNFEEYVKYNALATSPAEQPHTAE